jgi:hypothetical protein
MESEKCPLIGEDRKLSCDGQNDANGPKPDIGVVRRPTRFGRFAAGVIELTITPEGLL